MGKIRNILINSLGSFVLGIVSVIFFVCAGTISILNFRQLYYFDIEYLDIPGISGLSAEEIKLNYDALIDYNSPFFKGDLEFPTLQMSASGQYHFAEVKEIFSAMLIFGIFALIVLIIFMPLLVRRNRNNLKAIGIITFALPVALGAVIISQFSKIFVIFHEVLFNNDYWIFDATTDPVITILPEEFFMHCGIGILLFPLIGGLIMTIISVIINKKVRKHN